MLRKISLDLRLACPLEELLTLEASLRSGAPDAWAEVSGGVLALGAQIRQGAAALGDLVARLKRRPGVRLRLIVPAARPLTASVGIRHVELDIDVHLLLRGRDAGEHCRALHALLVLLRRVGWYSLDGRLGRDRVDDLARVIDALEEAAAGAQIFLDPSKQPDVRFDLDDEDAGAKATAQGATGAKAPEGKRPPIDEDEDDGPPRGKTGGGPAAKERGGKAREGRGKKPRASGGSFGGLPDDAQPSPRAPRGEWSQEIQFFLSYARLDWPSTVVEIKAAFRRVVPLAHPDQNPHDPGAQHRFILLKQGYEELLRLTEAG